MKIKCSKISERKINLIINCFISDVTSIQCSKIANINRKTSDRYYNLFRNLIVKQESVNRDYFIEDKDSGIEVDESYFGARRVRGKRGRGASGKTIVLGLLKRKGGVYVKILTKAEKSQILPTMLDKISPGSDIYTDGWRSYDALALYGYNHYTVNHGKNEFARDGKYHVNGIESFWSYAKRRLSKFNGVGKDSFERYLLETEWRFNNLSRMKSELRKVVKKVSCSS